MAARLSHLWDHLRDARATIGTGARLTLSLSGHYLAISSKLNRLQLKACKTTAAVDVCIVDEKTQEAFN